MAIIGVVVILSLLGLYLRFQFRADNPLWHDEIYQISQMNGSFWDMIRMLPRYEFGSYISGDHYLIYPFYKAYFDNVWGLAIPHIIATIVSFYLFYLICRKYLKSVWGFAAAFAVFSLNATLIEKAFEIRTYSMLVLLELASFYILQLMDEEGFQFKRIKKWKAGLFFILVIWFHAYAIAIVFVPAVYFLGRRLGSDSFKPVLWRMVKFFSVVLAITMPVWLISVFGRHLDYESFPFGGVFHFIPDQRVNPLGFFKAIFGNLLGFKPLYVLLLGLVALFWPLAERKERVWFFLSMIILPVFLILCVNLMTGYYFIQRQFIWVMPFFAMFLGWCWETLIPPICVVLCRYAPIQAHSWPRGRAKSHESL